MGTFFEKRRPVGRPRGRKENAVWRNAPDTKLEGGSKEQRMLEEVNWRGHCPKIGPKRHRRRRIRILLIN